MDVKRHTRMVSWALHGGKRRMHLVRGVGGWEGTRQELRCGPTAATLVG